MDGCGGSVWSYWCCDGCSTLDPLWQLYYIPRREQLHVGRFMKQWKLSKVCPVNSMYCFAKKNASCERSALMMWWCIRTNVHVWLQSCVQMCCVGTAVFSHWRRDRVFFCANTAAGAALLNYFIERLAETACRSVCKQPTESLWETQIHKVDSLRTYCPAGWSGCIPLIVLGFIFTQNRDKKL